MHPSRLGLWHNWQRLDSDESSRPSGNDCFGSAGGVDKKKSKKEILKVLVAPELPQRIVTGVKAHLYKLEGKVEEGNENTSYSARLRLLRMKFTSILK
jgi:hypothetical protein